MLGILLLIIFLFLGIFLLGVIFRILVDLWFKLGIWFLIMLCDIGVLGICCLGMGGGVEGLLNLVIWLCSDFDMIWCWGLVWFGEDEWEMLFGGVVELDL